MSDIEGTTEIDKSVQTLVSGLVGTVATINQTVFFLVIACFIGLLLASFPDVTWLDSSRSVELPFAGGAPIGLIIVILPIVLVAAQAYLNFQLQHLKVIDKALANRLAIPPVLHPSQHAGVGFVTTLIRYILVPLVLLVLAWKALPFPEKFVFLATALLVSLLISAVSLVNISNRFVVAAVVFICTLAIASAMGSPYYRSVLGMSDLGGQSYLRQYKTLVSRPLNLYLANLSKISLLNEYDLEAAILTEANLSNALLRKVNLTNANLRRANLSDAFLTEAKFINAKLQRANLSDAFLTEAKFINAKLQRANLAGADLSGASFKKADLTHADLSNSTLYYTKFENTDMECTKLDGADLSYADLTKAKGLTRSQISSAKSIEKAKLPPKFENGSKSCD